MLAEREKEMNFEVQGMTMTEALDIILYKARNNRLIIRRHQLLMRDQERKLQRPVKEFMDYMTRKLKAGIPGMKGKTAAQRAKSIVNWDEIRAEGQKILQPAELEVLLAGIDSITKQRMKKQARVDPIGIEAVIWAQTHTAELVVEIMTATMEAIKEIITAGIEAGKSMPAIAMELRPIVGLTSQYAGAVDKLTTELYTRPKYSALTNMQRNSKVDTYAGRLHRRRTATIARTETAFGLTEGQREGYDQMGIKNLERVEDPACCDICAEYNGKIYTIAEAEGVLPEHPNCEGTFVAAG